MQWSADVSAGDWLAARVDPVAHGTIHDVVPRGYPTYTRVFHPATRDRPVGALWPRPGASRRDWLRFQEARPVVDVEEATWGEAARSLRTRMHPLAQWHRLVHDQEDPRDAAGWRWSAPREGHLDAAALVALAEDLRSSTTTPDHVYAAVWEGWGGLLGGVGFANPRTVLLGLASEDEAAHHHAEMLARSIPNPLENGYRTPTWQPGALDDEVSRGPRLRLPGRKHVLFRGRLDELAGTLPWAEPDDLFAPSPSLVWPADRAWIVVTEVDFDSTIVAGPASVAAVLADDPRLETLPLPADADLRWDADEVNR